MEQWFRICMISWWYESYPQNGYRFAHNGSQTQTFVIFKGVFNLVHRRPNETTPFHNRRRNMNLTLCIGDQVAVEIKGFLRVSWDTRGIIYIDYFENRRTINAILLDGFNDNLKRNDRIWPKFSLFHQESTCVVPIAKFNELCYQFFPHSISSQGLLPVFKIEIRAQQLLFWRIQKVGESLGELFEALKRPLWEV